MIITWVEINKVKASGQICNFYKEQIMENTMKDISVKFKGWGNGDADRFFLHNNCFKQENGESHIKYGERLLTLNKYEK